MGRIKGWPSVAPTFDKHPLCVLTLSIDAWLGGFSVMIPISHFLRSNYGTDPQGPQEMCMVISMTLTLELSAIPTFLSLSY